MAGRPPDPNRKGTSYMIQFPDQKFINSLDILARREGITRKALILKFCEEGLDKHGPGNPQTLLNSYDEGGAQTINHLIGRARQFFLKRGRASRSEVLMYLKEEGVKGIERVSITKGLLSWLKEKGIEVLA